MITIRLLTLHLDNLVRSTNGLDPADLKSGQVKVRVVIDASERRAETYAGRAVGCNCIGAPPELL